MQFKTIVSLAVLTAGAHAICPGFNFGIADLGGQSYKIFDDACNVVSTIDLGGRNACTDGPFTCTPPPVTINGAQIEGNQYACRSDPNSGSCNGQGITVCCRNDGN